MVDHVTSLDPHPVDGLSKDWGMTNYVNTMFADNYYRIGDGFNGESVAGSINTDLSRTLAANGSAGCFEHELVHTLYHGTIDVSQTAIDGCQIRDVWFQQSIPATPRLITGYAFSRYADPSVLRPLGGIYEHFIDWAGRRGQGVRTDVEPSNQVWPNVGFDQRSTIPTGIAVGQTVEIPYHFIDRNSEQTIIFSLDNDTNPFNDESGIRQIGIATHPRRVAGTVGSAKISWTASIAEASSTPRFIQAKTTNTRTDVARVRYDYYLKPITVESTPSPRPNITAISPPVLPGLPVDVRQPITIRGTGFARDSKLRFYQGSTLIGDRTPEYVSTTELKYNISVGEREAMWSVQVINGTAESDVKTFQVTAYTNPSSTTPTLPTVTVVASAASASEQSRLAGQFTISRSGGSTSALAVSYTLGGTAGNGVDYDLLTGTATIAAGATLVD